MPFDVIETIATTRDERPARVSLVKARPRSRACCYVAVSPQLAAAVGAKAGDRFEVLVGSGAHRGLMRLVRGGKKAVAKTRALKGGWLVLRLGHIAAFPDEAHQKQGCNAEALDADTIEIVLPAWADDHGGASPPDAARPAMREAPHPDPLPASTSAVADVDLKKSGERERSAPSPLPVSGEREKTGGAQTPSPRSRGEGGERSEPGEGPRPAAIKPVSAAEAAARRKRLGF